MNPLRSLFGPRREEAWRAISDEIGADYLAGTGWKRDKVVVTVGEWTITLDTEFSAATKSDDTRLRAPLPASLHDGFGFKVYRRGLFSDLAKAFGRQDVEVGHAEFDRDFVIQGSDAARLRALFDDAEVRSRLAAEPRVHFSLGPAKGGDAGSSGAELRFTTPGVIRDKEHLRRLFDLFAAALDRLCEIAGPGVAGTGADAGAEKNASRRDAGLT